MIDNQTGENLIVYSSFFSAFDGLSLVLLNKDGKDLRGNGTVNISPLTSLRQGAPISSRKAVERISPLGLAATRLDYVYLTPGGRPVSDETLAMSDAVLAEDRWIVERVQVNLDAGVYRTGRLSPRHEGAVGAFQGFVADALGG